MPDPTPARKAFSVSIFARNDGELLLIHHRRLGRWLPAGGEIEPGETPLEAAARELLEETGLTGQFSPLAGALPGEPPGLLGYEEHLAGSKGTHLNFCFVADVATREVRPNGELSDFRWVREARSLGAPENVQELVRRALGPDLAALGREWLRHVNARDLDLLLALYAEDAVHLSPKLRVKQPATGGRVLGKAALRGWWEDCFRRLPGLRYVERSVTADAAQVIVEYLRECPGEAPLEVLERFRCRGGRIVESAVFHG
ncbi:MAG: NUDIX domain-containing protein [Deltaproteobacteria bacterium]